MHKYCLSLVFLIILKTAAAQLPELQWAKAFVPHNEYNPSVYSNGRSIAVDNEGNVYSAGLFNYITDFDPGPGDFALSADNWANTAIYISKLSATGDFLWAIQIPTYVEFGNIEIKIDGDNNVYIASELRLATDFDPGPSVYTLSPTGGWDTFVAKYDPKGKLVWAKQFGGPGDTVPRPDVLDIDNDNNVIVCGNFNNTVDFDPGPNTFTLTSSAHIQAFIVKLTSNGDFVWAEQFGNSPVVLAGSSIADVKCDSEGNIYTVGLFSGNCDFDPGSNNYMLQATSLGDGFISKLDANGRFVWAKRIGNTTNDYYQFAHPTGIDVDGDNNVYTIGSFIGTFDFDPGVNAHVITSQSNYDWYVLKQNAQGDFVWVAVIGGNERDLAADVAVDHTGNVYAVGSIVGSADMDPGSGTYMVIPQGRYETTVLTKLDANGDFIYAAPFDGVGVSLPKRMVVDPYQNIYITGYMSGTLDFDPGSDVFTVSSSLAQSPFVVKLVKCKNVTTAVLDISTCENYSLNNEIFDSSGTYIRTIPNVAGCDSIITLHLSINKKLAQREITICEGESFYAGGTAQTSTGIYIDTLQTSLGCDSIVTTHLTVHPAPLPDLGPDRDLCTGTVAVLNPGAFTTYLWQDGSHAHDFRLQAPGIYWVRVTNDFDCQATDSFRVRSMLPSPADFLRESDSVCSYGQLQIRAAGNFNAYQWSTGASTKQVQVDHPGKYWLTVTDANGCAGTDSISVYEKDCMEGVYIPTAFTPNKDGKNDVFRAMVFGTIRSFMLQVFDRGGQLIFETTDPAKGWNGVNKGISYSTSVFVWQCFYQLEGQGPSYQKGTVVVIR